MSSKRKNQHKLLLGYLFEYKIDFRGNFDKL